MKRSRPHTNRLHAYSHCKMHTNRKYALANRVNCVKRNNGRKFTSVYLDVTTTLSTYGLVPGGTVLSGWHG